MTNKERSIEEIVEEFDAFLDQYTGKVQHKDNELFATLYADTVKVRKDIIIAEFTQTLQTERQKREEVVKETLEEAGNYVDELYQSGNMGENEFELLTEFFDEKLTQPNN